MNQIAAIESCTNIDRIETNPAFVYGYDRALRDIRASLCFEGDDHGDLNIVLTLLERQNAALLQASLPRR